MKCAIEGLQIGDQIKNNSVNVDPKYFTSKAFLERFGEWRTDKISTEELANNKQDTKRFNEDGSPKLYSHANESELSYYNKHRTRIPIIREYFKSLPIELRSTIPSKAVKSMVANLLLSPELSDAVFESGETITFDLSNFYDEQVEVFDEEGVSDELFNSLTDDKNDYMEAIRLELKALGVHYSEADVEIDANGNEAIKQPPSIQRNPLDKASAVIKGIIEFIPQRDIQGRLVTHKHMGNLRVMMNRSFVWYKILEHMSDLSFSRDGSVTEQFVNHLSKLVKTEPWVQTLVDSLKEGDEELRLAFVAATNNVKNVLFNTEYNVNTGFITRDAVNLNTNTNNIAKSWASGLHTKFSVDETKKEAFTHMVSAMNLALKDLTLSRDRNSVQDSLEEIQTIIGPIFDQFDMKVPSSITHIAFRVYQEEKHSKLTESEKSTITDVVDIQSFKNWLIKSTDAMMGMGAATEEGKVGMITKHFSPYLEAMLLVNQEEAGNHMVTAGKNRIYVYSLPSILQETISDWKANPEDIAKFLQIPGAKNSQFLKSLNDPQNISDLRLGIKGILHIEGRNRKNADTKEIKAGDYAKVDFNNVMRVLGTHAKRVPIYSTQLAADKGTEMQFEGMNFVNTIVLDDNGIYNMKASIAKAAKEVFIPYVKDEYDNMLKAKQDISEALTKALKKAPQAVQDLIAENMEEDGEITTAFYNAAYKENHAGLKEVTEEAAKDLVMFYHLDTKGNLMNLEPESVNLGSFVGGAFQFKIPHTMNSVTGLFSPDNLPALPTSDLLTLDDDLRSKIEEVVEEGLKAKVISYTDKARNIYNIDASPNKQGSPSSISADILNFYKKNSHPSDTNIELQMYHDYIINSMMSKVEYSKLFTGPQQFYKHSGDYIKRVPSTYADGLMMATNYMNKTFKQLTFTTEGMENSPLNGSDWKIAPSEGWEHDEIPAEVRDYYNFVDRTDAQGWITPDRWADIMKGIGKFDSKAKAVHAKMKAQWKLVLANKPIPVELNFSKDEVKTLSAQPLKGVFFRYEIGGTPQYIKYSQAVLIPSFINNNPKAKQLAAYMEKHGIDEAIAETGVKVGARRPQQLFDEAGNINNFKEAPYISELPNSNWRLQQDLPTKTMKDTKVGIQVQKIVMSALAFSGDTTKRSQIQKALSDLSDAGLQALHKKFGIDSNNLTVTDVDKFYKTLLDDMLKKEVPEDNLIRAIKAHTDISLLPSMKDKLISGIMSTIKKAATDLMTNGGAMIQVSDQLIGKTEALNSGITMLVDDLDRLQPPRLEWQINKNGERVQRVISGQVMIPHRMIAELVPDYASKSPEELRKILTPESLQIIGYRIPTQAKASVDALEIIGILPAEMGDSIITYAEITAKTGSDFDIDKMFLIVPDLMREVSYSKSTFDYNGIKVSYNDKLTTRDTKKPVMAKSYHHKDGTHSIRINDAMMRDAFKKRAWKNPRELIDQIDGGKEIKSKMELFPDNVFPTFEDFKQFILEHEYQHTVYSREAFMQDTMGHGTSGQYETAINNLAFKAIKKLGSNPIEDNKILGKVVKVPYNKAEGVKVAEEETPGSDIVSTVTTTNSVEVEVEGLKGIAKPTVTKVKYLSSTQLVNSDNPISAKQEQDKLKEEFKELEDLINCLWK